MGEDLQPRLQQQSTEIYSRKKENKPAWMPVYSKKRLQSVGGEERGRARRGARLETFAARKAHAWAIPLLFAQREVSNNNASRGQNPRREEENMKSAPESTPPVLALRAAISARRKKGLK